MDIDPNLEFMNNCFRSYYRASDFEPPPRFTRREWGFFMFGANNMIRHKKFDSKKDLRDFLASRGPMHSYCSTAYYKDPALTPMPKKQEGWLGADLIFDIDADHLKDAESMTYTEQLENVREMILKLLFDFLLPDFGFAEENVEVYFSGGRGYHIHITDPRVLPLDSKDRQEIVDYISGVGLNEESVIPKEHFDKKVFQGHVSTMSRRKMYAEGAPGWKGKIRQGAVRLLDQMQSLPKDEALEYIMKLKEDAVLKGVMGETVAKNLYSELFSPDSKGETAANKIKREGVLDNLSQTKLREAFFKLVVAYTRIEMTGKTDEPVTKDVKRLLRMPYSLHGKTGFKVVKVALEAVRHFDPLKEAVVLPDRSVKLEVTKPLEIILKGQSFNLVPGPTELPLFAAYFALGRRCAKLV